MSKADELLRELLTCRDAMAAKKWIIDPDEELSSRYQSAWATTRAYLNAPADDGQTHQAASPPHAERCEHGVRWEHPCRVCNNPNRGDEPIKDAGGATIARSALDSGGVYDNTAAPASPPHAEPGRKLTAEELEMLRHDPFGLLEPLPHAEPVGQPVAWYMPIGGLHSIIEWGAKRPDRVGVVEWQPLYASPLAQPIAREPQEFYGCPECGHDTWLKHADDCSVRKSAGKE